MVTKQDMFIADNEKLPELIRTALVDQIRWLIKLRWFAVGEEALVELEALDMKREDKLLAYAAVVKELNILAAGAKAEAAKLTQRAKSMETRVAWLSARLEESVPTNSEIANGPHRIWWRRTTSTVFTTTEVPRLFCKHTPEKWEPQVSLAKKALTSPVAEEKAAAEKCAETKRGWKLQID